MLVVGLFGGCWFNFVLCGVGFWGWLVGCFGFGFCMFLVLVWFGCGLRRPWLVVGLWCGGGRVWVLTCGLAII